MSNAINTMVTKSKLTIDKQDDGSILYEGEYQKEGTLSFQVRQTVTTESWYQGKKVSNELNGSLFSASEFGAAFAPQKFVSDEERVAWPMVPIGITEEQLIAKLATAPNACIYRVLSSAPILSEDQKYSIKKGFKTLDDYADAQVVRYGEGHGKEGQLILDEAGRPQYRKTFFWTEAREDEDHRGEVEVYYSEAMKEEINGVGTASGFVATDDIPF